MPRYKLLQVLDVALVAPAIDPPAPKLDVAVEYVGVDGDGRFTFSIPAYDTTTHNTLDALHVSLYEKPADGTAPAVPASGAEIVAAPLHFSVSTAALQGGGKVVVDATAAPEGNYAAALVAEFDQ